LDSLLSALPSLESSSRIFAQQTREIQKDRRQANMVLEHHDKLYDVLSLPLLLDSCVRNHNYNEALLLSNHAAQLSERFPSNPLIQSVREDCDARIQTMLGQLLAMLSEQAKLPALFRAVTFLRKMEVLGEEELALAFLTGRGVYLDSALQAIEIETKGRVLDKEGRARYLKRYVDAWRECVYDVITQYTTIFLDRAPSTSSTLPTTLHRLLTTFTAHHLQILLALLRQTLPLIPDPSLLTSLLTQLTFCANSFARVGMDFKVLLAPLFMDAVRKAVSQELESAVDALRAKLLPPSSGKTKAVVKSPSQLLITPLALSAPPVPTAELKTSISASAPNVPPQILASYPPLALYTNAVLTALNGLRMLAPAELLDDVASILDGTLAKAGSALLQYTRQKSWKSDAKTAGGDPGVVAASNAIFFDVFVPFARRALIEGVYGQKVEEIKTGSSLLSVLQDYEEFRKSNANGI